MDYLAARRDRLLSKKKVRRRLRRFDRKLLSFITISYSFYRSLIIYKNQLFDFFEEVVDTFDGYADSVIFFFHYRWLLFSFFKARF